MFARFTKLIISSLLSIIFLSSLIAQEEGSIWGIIATGDEMSDDIVLLSNASIKLNAHLGNNYETLVETFSNENGGYEIVIPSEFWVIDLYDALSLHVQKGGFASQIFDLPMTQTDYPLVINFFLVEDTELEIYLYGNVYLNESSNDELLPINGALIEIFGGFSGGLLAETTTADSGYYEFGGIASAACTIQVSAEGFITQEMEIPEVDCGDGRCYPVEMNFYLEQTCNEEVWISGMVCEVFQPDEDLYCFSGANVIVKAINVVNNTWETLYQTETTNDGYYEIPTMCYIDIYTDFSIEVSFPGYETQMQLILANASIMDFYLEQTNPNEFVLFGHVTGGASQNSDDWHDLEGAVISIAELQGGPIAVSDASGNYDILFEWPVWGPITVNCSHNEYPLQMGIILQYNNANVDELNFVVLAEPICVDISGIYFGPCEMVLGFAWDGENCVGLSGCGWGVDGINYSNAFFNDFEACEEACYVIDTDPHIPVANFQLMSAYPNPFNPTTIVSYQCPKPSPINLAIYNINGRLVETLVNETMTTGYHEALWDATNYQSGMYFVKLTANGFKQTQKIMLLK